jgi:glycolate oxidase iron-sulfur subunit
LPVRGVPAVARLVLAVFARTRLLRMTLLGARMFRATRLPQLFARLLPERLAFPMAMLASTTPQRFPTPSAATRPGATRPAAPPPTARTTSDATPTTVTCLQGCVMDGLFGHVNAATERVLTHNGYTVLATAAQHCCGALHAHAGDLAQARALARRNIAAFEQHPTARIAVNSAGCGAMLKQYGHLLADDPAWAARATAVAARTNDVSELLAARGPVTGGALPLRVTHDPPCHQMHAQRVVTPPMAVLSAIPGMTLVPLVDADQCCGSAGIYNLVEPDTSNAVLAPKLDRIAETGAAVVATGNPGCLMQIGAGLIQRGVPTRAVHPVELLDASYRGNSAAGDASPRA